jgi:hypothetical protein
MFGSIEYSAMSSSHSSGEGILSRTQTWSDIIPIRLPITKLNQMPFIAVESAIPILYLMSFIIGYTVTDGIILVKKILSICFPPTFLL